MSFPTNSTRRARKKPINGTGAQLALSGAAPHLITHPLSTESMLTLLGIDKTNISLQIERDANLDLARQMIHYIVPQVAAGNS